MDRPTDPYLVASLCLVRQLWLALPLAERRRHWADAADQLGQFAAIRGWVELRAYDIAGIHRGDLRRLIRSREHAEALVRQLGHLLDVEPLAEDGENAPGEAFGDSGDRFGVRGSGAA